MKLLSALILTVLLLTSCREVKIEKQALNMKRIMLLSIRANSAAVTKEDLVPYPDVHFGGEIFRDSLISNFNASSNGLSLVTAPELIDVPASEVRLRTTNTLPIKLNYDEKRLTNKEYILRLLESCGADSWAVLHLNFSIWKQCAEGELFLYSKDSQLIWKQEIRAVSTYILKDPASPYLSEYDFADENLETKKTHAEELQKVFTEMGEAAAAQFNDAWQKLQPKTRKDDK